MLSDEDGARAVRLARATLVGALGASGAASRPGPLDADELSDVFREPRGAFVTLRKHPSGELRGCIGFPLPVHPLGRAIGEAAVSAAREDPRFPPVRASELSSLSIEVSVLTVPVPLASRAPAERIREVRVGRDGLIVDGFGMSGLLLPQVAPEQGWDSEELLAGTCEKAGLPPYAWKDPRVRVRRFEADAFEEKFPGGPVVRSSG
jgi:uncharacterized protein